MYQEPISLLDGSIYAYLIVERSTLQILDGNQLARNFYKPGREYPLLDSIFVNVSAESAIENIVKNLNDEGSVILYDLESIKGNGEKIRCNVEICNLNESLLFWVIKEKSKSKDLQIKELVELTDNPIFVIEPDDDLTVYYGNLRCYQCICMEKDEFSSSLNSSFLKLLQEEKQISFLEKVTEQLEQYGECDVDIELTFDGEYFQLFRFNAYKSLYDNKLYGVLISAKKQSELMKKIEYDQQYFDIMQEFSKDLLFRIDVKKRTLVHRGDISKFVGLSSEVENFPESMRQNQLIHPDDLEGYIAFVYRLMSGIGTSYEPRFLFSNGAYEKYRLQGKPLFDPEGNTVQVVGKSENIQKYVEIEARANYDSLTSTLNKQSFRDLIEEKFSRAVEKDKFGLLFLDIDDFKGVNDTLGHVFGDFLLEAIGKRILNCIRKQDRVGRVGGDEFVIFFQFAPSHESVLERAEAILHSLRREFSNGDLRHSTKGSIGIALFPEHGTSYDELYHKADLALYMSKSLGKDIATVYSEECKPKNEGTYEGSS